MIFIEEEALLGVKKIGEVLKADIALVTEEEPEIFVGTIGKSKQIDMWVKEGALDISPIEGKWECFLTTKIDGQIVIVGSDKRGTIYGMFSLSEALGVTPLIFFGDVAPQKMEKFEVPESFYQVSKEPSVRYRGFFINDEWPCYGNWVTKHYGDFNAQSYEKVFEFLLRMKGNYMWPAMWSASFPLDGPGSANEELADLYGVVMGYSHHEPCLRASEEWDKVKGLDSKYGNEWNYVLNKEGLIHYWEDALIRSGKYDNMITIGMRGERDSSMLGPDASVLENVELLKEIISKQKELIAKHVEPIRGKAPMLLALYKEVEDYFYGDENVEGLKEWEGLSDVTCMLCEDNHGYMRTLPTEQMRQQKQKFGMYYHFDYHGDPISYEWVDSTPLSKTWEQMCQAYEFGIKEVWIVNVGDLKFHEVPLTYFMKLAYDFDKWGSSNPSSAAEFWENFAKENFVGETERIQKTIARVAKEYIDINHLRRPEFLSQEVYHPCHYLEVDRMLNRAEVVISQVEEILKDMKRDGNRHAFFSMIAFPAVASMNNLKLWLYTAKNHHYASQGRQIANDYKALVEACMARDQELYDIWSSFLNGKWDGMQMASHVGFTKWNDFGCKNPITHSVYPQANARMNVSRKDDERLYDKIYGPAMTIELDDFMDLGTEYVMLEVANDGATELDYAISFEGAKAEWLYVTGCSGKVTKLEELVVAIDRDKMKKEVEETYFLISDGDTNVKVHVRAKKWTEVEKNVFYPRKHGIVMRADHYVHKADCLNGSFQVIENYGNYGAAVKAFPVTRYYNKNVEDTPSISYRFMIEESGQYQVKLYMSPTNPVMKGQALHVMVEDQLLEILACDYEAGVCRDQIWSKGVLDQIRTVETSLYFEKGIREITIKPVEPGFVLQQVAVFGKEFVVLSSYLGQEESFRIS